MAPKDDPQVELLKALAVAAELTGTELSDVAARVMAADLLTYPLPQVLTALSRCRRELKGRLTLAAILERLDDGRPGPNEAWAMIPQSEDASVVWTAEMQVAFGVAHPLLAAKQTIAARSAFIEAYEAAVAKARSEGVAVRWTPSLGHDKRHRAGVIEEAVRLGRLTQEHAVMLLPAPESATVTALLDAPRSSMPEDVRRQLKKFTKKVAL